jgi:ElaB/YqjD/DUF883 family membrane-anchored ribosome-binding protein
MRFFWGARGMARASSAAMDKDIDPTAKTTIKQSVGNLVDQSSETMGTVKARLGDVTDQVKDSGTVAYDKTMNYIEASPLKAVLIAFGAGYVAMRIKTSPLFKIAMLGGLAYLGTSFVRR